MPSPERSRSDQGAAVTKLVHVRNAAYVRRSRRPEPRVSVFCRCGAQWWGAVAVNNSIIIDHRNRCGLPITAARYQLSFHLKPPQGWTEADVAKATQ